MVHIQAKKRDCFNHLVWFVFLISFPFSLVSPSPWRRQRLPSPDMIRDRALLGSEGLQCEFIILLKVKKSVLTAPGPILEISEGGLGNAHELSPFVIVMGGTDVPHDLLSDFIALSDPCG